MVVRDLLALRPLLEGLVLQWRVTEAIEDMSIRDLYPRGADLIQLKDGEGLNMRDVFPGPQAELKLLKDLQDMPDLKELLERLRKLNGLDLGPTLQRYHIRMAELYYRKGRSTSFEKLKKRHEDNKALEARYRVLKRRLIEAHELFSKSRSSGVSPDKPDSHETKRYMDLIAETKTQMHEMKRLWVLAENAYASLHEPKTQIEVYLEAMRLKLLRVVREPEVFLGTAKNVERLERKLRLVNEQLRRDDDLLEEQRQLDQHAAKLRHDLEDLVARADHVLREKVWRRELRRLKQICVRQAMGIPGDSEKNENFRRAIQFLMLHHSKLFRATESSWKGTSGRLSQLLEAPIARLEANKEVMLDTMKLYAVEDSDRAKKARQIASYADQGYRVNVDNVTDPHLLATMVLEFCRGVPGGLLPKALVKECAKLPNPFGANTEKPSKDVIHRVKHILTNIPSNKRIHVECLFHHLHRVQRHKDNNAMGIQALSYVFAEALFQHAED